MGPLFTHSLFHLWRGAPSACAGWNLRGLRADWRSSPKMIFSQDTALGAAHRLPCLRKRYHFPRSQTKGCAQTRDREMIMRPSPWTGSCDQRLTADNFSSTGWTHDSFPRISSRDGRLNFVRRPSLDEIQEKTVREKEMAPRLRPGHFSFSHCVGMSSRPSVAPPGRCRPMHQKSGACS